MKRFMYALDGIALIITLFSVQAWANDAAPGSPALPSSRLASLQTPASITEPLGNASGQNVPMTLASASTIDSQREKSRRDYADIPSSQIVPAANPAASDQPPVSPTEPGGEIWMFLGGISIALMIAWRRCQWASLRGGSAISTGQRSPHPAQYRTDSPIGLSAGHGHLPFGG